MPINAHEGPRLRSEPGIDEHATRHIAELDNLIKAAHPEAALLLDAHDSITSIATSGSRVHSDRTQDPPSDADRILQLMGIIFRNNFDVVYLKYDPTVEAAAYTMPGDQRVNRMKAHVAAVALHQEKMQDETAG